MSTAANLTIWPTYSDQHGRKSDVSWERFFAELETPIAFQGMDQHAGWSPALFCAPGRAKDHVGCLTALVLDVDGGWSLQGAETELARYYGFIHTTKKHTDEVHRFRIILPLTRGVTPEEHAVLWREFAARYEGKFDPACKDPNRFWYLPGVIDDGPYAALRLGGLELDPDPLLAAAAERRENAPTVSVATDPADRIEKRALAYLDAMPAAISGSGGHAAAWGAAVALARGFALPESDVYRMLRDHYNPRCRPPWSDRELRHKVDNAMRADAELGYILNRDESAPPVELPPEPRRLELVDDDEPEPLQPAVQRYGVRTMHQVLKTVYDRCYSNKPAPFVSTGVHEVDRLIGGYRPEMVTCLGAQTNWGKSAWAVLAIDDGIRAGKRILYVSGEDSEDLIGKRIMARRAHVSASALRDERIDAKTRRGNGNTDMSNMASVVTAAEQLPWFFDGRGKSAEYCANAVRELVREVDYQLVIVDYLQAFRSQHKAQDRRNEVTNVARAFTDAIKSAKASGLLLSQLKRLDSENREPTKHDLKESGDVENMAEHVLLGWTRKDGQRCVKVDKNKDGPQYPRGVELDWHEDTASFTRTAAWQGDDER